MTEVMRGATVLQLKQARVYAISQLLDELIPMRVNLDTRIAALNVERDRLRKHIESLKAGS